MDIRKAIEKLNSIDAKDLKKINFGKLKEYNFGRIKEEFVSKPTTMIKGVLIALTVIIVLYSFTAYKTAGSKINKEIEQAQAKLDMIEKKKITQTAYDQFFNNFPKTIPNNQLIGRLSEFAEESNINILSFSPVKTNETEYTRLYIVNLNVEAETYQDLVDFVHTIENSVYSLRVNKWSARSSKRFSNFKGEKEAPVNAFIEIGSIGLKDV